MSDSAELESAIKLIDELSMAEHFSKEKYTAIGRFIVRFELAIDTMRIGIVAIFQNSGLTPPKLAYGLVGSPVVTAMPMLKMFVATIAEAHQYDGDLRRILKWFESEMSSLADKRNDVVHGTWRFDFLTASKDPVKLLGRKFNPSRSGINTKSMPETIEDLDVLSREADQLQRIALRLIVSTVEKHPINRYLHCKKRGGKTGWSIKVDE